MILKKLFYFSLITIACPLLALYANESWNWQNIDISAIAFSKNFLWGASICEYQNSGSEHCKASNWAQWEATKFANGKPHIVNNEKSGKACDHWHLYKHDIELMKTLNLTSFRFSVDWSKIEPQEGCFDEQALQHYVDLCDELLKAGIEPMVTLHHFVHPQWFEDKGAFEDEANIVYFTRFCIKIFNTLADKVKLWCTINEPTIYAFQGYIRGVFPPGKVGIGGLIPTPLAARVLRNLLKAHVEVYRALKKQPYGEQAKIGLVHQYLQFVPYSSWNLPERLPGYLLNNFLNKSVLDFLTTGNFNYSFSLPCLISAKSDYKVLSNEKFLDFIGLNYYSRALVTIRFGHPPASCYPHETMTDMPYAIYAQGLYEAIKDVAQFKVPIYITENGIADAHDNRRKVFIEQYLYALSKALSEGYDVRGFYYWSLMDNFEWDMGTTMKFGLYHVDFKTQERTLRKGSYYYADVIKRAKEGLLSPLQSDSREQHFKQA